VFFFTILLSSTIQTLARRHHLPFDHATNRVNVASLFFSPSVTLKKQKRKKRSTSPVSSRHKPSQRRFLVFLLRLRQKKNRNKKDRHLSFDHDTNRVNAASLFFSFGYVKKTETKKENEGERIQSGCLISVVLDIPFLNWA
jgi:phage terminase large subunit